jgi:hypothetical protein
MSWVFVVTVALLVAAIVLIEVRAVRTGDERQHHAPGYALVMGGLVVIGVGIAAAMSEHTVIALLASAAGLLLVAFGSTRHKEAIAH